MLIQITIAAFIFSALAQDRYFILGSLAGLGVALCVG
ncbi:hypothetical protein JOE50_008002 [Bradyrhizobium japonicum]|nr:hypothetical protein [Bradyrhizobium japonicum]